MVSSLYQAKDNDMLLSMPIPTSRILLVRLSGVYAMGLMYELIDMLNCGLGVILMPVFAAVLVWKADLVQKFILLPAIQECIPLLAVATICLLMTMNDMAAPSISMEGKNLWIVQSPPVSGKQVLLSKLKLPLLLTWISAIPLVIVVEWLIKPSLLNGILIPAVACFYAVLITEIGLVLNLKMPNLHWTSEIIPLKQSAPVTIALLGGWLIIVALAGIYILLRNVVSVTAFGILLCTVLLIAVDWLYHWLTKIFLMRLRWMLCMNMPSR